MQNSLISVGRSRLLPAEIVGRHAEHDEAAIAIALPQASRSLYCGVYPQNEAVLTTSTGRPAPRIERQSLAVDRNKLETGRHPRCRSSATSGGSEVAATPNSIARLSLCAAAGFRVARLQSFPETDGAGVRNSARCFWYSC